jgi:Tol biopolymer transport system component
VVVSGVLALGICLVPGPQWAVAEAADRAAGAAAAGTGEVEANGSSAYASASADGRVVAFVSSATNLAPDDNGSSTDVFVRDLALRRTTRVVFRKSLGGFDVLPPSLSATGRFIAFQGQADDLVPGDTNNLRDMFVRDLSTGTTERVSVSSAEAQANGMADGSSISGTGRFVSFFSAATNLVAGDTNGVLDIFVRDRQLGVTERVSVGSDGRQANRGSFRAAISSDGRFVAFLSLASNLVTSDTGSVVNVFIRDRWRGTTQLVSVGTHGAAGNENSDAMSISADGRFVAFRSAASNLVPGAGDGRYHIFVRDLQLGTTRQVDLATSGAPGQGETDSPHISADGQYVAFTSTAQNLTPGDTNTDGDVFVRDLLRGVTTAAAPGLCGGRPTYQASAAGISVNGRYVTFVSAASNLVPGDINSRSDVFVRDLYERTTSRVSVGASP